MYIHAPLSGYSGQKPKRATSYSRLVESLNAKAEKQSISSIQAGDLLSYSKAITDIRKAAETYQSLKYMEGTYRGVASKRRQEMEDFQSLTGQRDALAEELETEREILSMGGRTDNGVTLSWDGPMVAVQGHMLESNVSPEQALQVDTPLKVSDSPIEDQITVGDTSADQPPTPLERSQRRIAALEQKLAKFEIKINEFVEAANLSDQIEQRDGLCFSYVPTVVKALENSERDDGKKIASEYNKNELFMKRTRENFLEKTAQAAAEMESKADGCLDAMNRMYDQYKKKYGISLGLV